MTAEPIAVLVSGGGRSLENLAECIARGELDARIALVLADRPGTGAFERAERLGLSTHLVDRRAFDGAAAFSRAVFGALDASGARLACLAGFLRLLRIPPAWSGRVINIHPSLLPAYGGKGFYGHHVHEAVLAAGEKESGCTVHFVDDQFDHGEPILQRRVPVLPGDTAETLAARVFEEEKRALPEAIRLVLAGEATLG
ncbi:MAG TPA: phosphoribosylglycinamide formyltransferase [Planctomycetes bacterium]|nr:phosphoribosylglycinamide formyltransferase [Planctomycetota bacterium]